MAATTSAVSAASEARRAASPRSAATGWSSISASVGRAARASALDEREGEAIASPSCFPSSALEIRITFLDEGSNPFGEVMRLTDLGLRRGLFVEPGREVGLERAVQEHLRRADRARRPPRKP